MTDGVGVLRLIGWYGSEGHGYAVPLFGQTEGANTLCMACCSASGDHRATIADFEPVEVVGYERLPLGESIPATVGDPWLDVFVWRGRGYVGTPEELWVALGRFHRELGSEAPLSFLDLALSAGRRDEALGFAPRVFSFVNDRFDRRIAQGWRRGFLRQYLETESRRKLAGQGYLDEDFRSITVEQDQMEGLTAVVPRPMLKTLTDLGAISQVSENLAELAGAMRSEVVLHDYSHRTEARRRSTGPRGGSETRKAPGCRYVMTLQRTDVGVGQTTAGTSRRSPEIFIPLKARDTEPGFWDWQGGFEEDPKRTGKFDRRGVRMRVGDKIVGVNMMTWPVKHDFRLRSEALRSLGNVGDILVMEKVAGAAFEYDVGVVSVGSADYQAMLARCDQSVRNSKKRFGYY